MYPFVALHVKSFGAASLCCVSPQLYFCLVVLCGIALCLEVLVDVAHYCLHTCKLGEERLGLTGGGLLGKRGFAFLFILLGGLKRVLCEGCTRGRRRTRALLVFLRRACWRGREEISDTSHLNARFDQSSIPCLRTLCDTTDLQLVPVLGSVAFSWPLEPALFAALLVWNALGCCKGSIRRLHRVEDVRWTMKISFPVRLRRRTQVKHLVCLQRLTCSCQCI